MRCEFGRFLLLSQCSDIEVNDQPPLTTLDLIIRDIDLLELLFEPVGHRLFQVRRRLRCYHFPIFYAETHVGNCFYATIN